MIKIKEGIYEGIPFDEYQQWDAVSNTILAELIDRSPLHAKTLLETPKEQTPALVTGEATHCAILEPDVFDNRYAVAPECDKRTKDGKTLYEEFLATVDERTILNNEQYRICQAIKKSFEQQKIRAFIEKGASEVCIVWLDKKSDVLCKARLDYVRRDLAFIFDVKTTEDACEKSFQRAIYNYNYHQKAAFYCEGWKTLTGDDTVFTFIAAEKTAPYAIAAYEAHEDLIFAGKQKFRKALESWSECVKTGFWPCYGSEVKMINLPEFALREAGVNQYNMQRKE